MDRQELTALGARLKAVLCEVMPEQSVTAKAGFHMDSGVVTLSFQITSLHGYCAEEEAI